jgi:hypothetical protein
LSKKQTNPKRASRKPSLLQWIRDLVRWYSSPKGSEKRETRRYYLPIRVIATPVDDRRMQAGQEFEVIVRDISDKGMCLYHTASVDSRHLMIKLEGPTGHGEPLHMEVLRCRENGRFFAVAGRFTM